MKHSTWKHSTTTGVSAASRNRLRMAGETSPTSRAGNSIIVFAEDPDRLLCDPHNSLWVYTVFEYKYGCPDAECRDKLYRLLKRVETVAMLRFEASVKLFQSLPVPIQHFQVLRAVPLGFTPNIIPTGSGHLFRRNSQGSAFEHSFSSCTTRNSVYPLMMKRADGRLAPISNAQQPSLAAGLNVSRTADPKLSTPGLPEALDEAATVDLSLEEVEVADERNGEASLKPPLPLRVPEDTAVRILASHWPPLVGLSELEEQYLALKRENGENLLPFNSTTSGNDRVLSPHDTFGEKTTGVYSSFFSEQSRRPSFSDTPCGSRMKGRSGSLVQRRRQSALTMASFTSSVGSSHPKIKVVLDMVASRKTLGGDPPNSPPYKLGQWVYHYYHGKPVKRGNSIALAAAVDAATNDGDRNSFAFLPPNAPQSRSLYSGRSISDSSVLYTQITGAARNVSLPGCTQVFVGISDSPIKMVGRDFLFPFKVLPVGSSHAGGAQHLPLNLTASQLLLRSYAGPLHSAAGNNLSTNSKNMSGTGMSSANPNPMGILAPAPRFRSLSSCSNSSRHSGDLNRGMKYLTQVVSPSHSQTVGAENKQGEAGNNNSTFPFIPCPDLPICIRQPPIHLEAIDQKRFIICHPNLEFSELSPKSG